VSCSCREACYLCKRGTTLGDREITGAVLLSLLAVPRIYPKSPLSLPVARVGVYPKSRLSLLELGLAAPQACVACDAGFATLEVAAGWDRLLLARVCGFVEDL